MSQTRCRPPRAFVTAASSGLGAACAERLAHGGSATVIVARRRERLESLAEQLKSNHHIDVEVLVADLSKRTDLDTVEKRIREDSSLEMLVNNAGFGGYMPFIELDPDKAEELINLKVLAVTRLTRAALPGMIARGRGAIINVSSLAAFVPGPYDAIYGATKAFVNSFTEALHEELRGTGVRVQALCPGFVHTELQQRAGIDTSRLPAFAWM